MKYTRVYDISKLKELKASEKKLNDLYNNYKHVQVIVVGLDKIRIEYK